jgi:murein tripeptide amidase MpaA
MTDLTISTCFDSGAIEVLRLDDPSDIQLRIRSDNAADFAQWFHFRLQGAAGVPLTLRFMNAGACAYPRAGRTTASWPAMTGSTGFAWPRPTTAR